MRACKIRVPMAELVKSALYNPSQNSLNRFSNQDTEHILEQFLKKGELVVCGALNVPTVNWSSQVYHNEDEGSVPKLCEEGIF